MRFLYLCLLLFLGSCFSEENITHDSTELKSNKFGEPLYIKTTNWGITGDTQITVISEDSIVDFNRINYDKCYVFHGLEPFLYKQVSDSLFLYTQTKIDEPKFFKSKWRIVQIEIDNATMMELYQNEEYHKP